MVLPLRTFHRRLAGNRNVTLIQVSVREGESTEAAKAEIERLMRKRRHINAKEQDDFSVRDMKEVANMLTETTKLLTTLLSAVAAVSLLVGGIGIMNIMLVSVTERTREIGIRLAIGALEREVLMQFPGGGGGPVLPRRDLGDSTRHRRLSIGLADLLEVPYVFNGGIVVTAFGFSAAVGVIFGYFPARRAARLDPIEALRRE